MKTFVIIIILFASASITEIMAQTENLGAQAEMIEHEGKMLFYSEKASWHGTDIFLEKFKEPNLAGGYFSYPYMDSVRCIFVSKPPLLKVIFSATFDKSFNLNKVNISLDERNLTPDESSLYNMRSKVFDLIYNEGDTIFKHYENTNLNIIPIINGKLKRVYILTGPTTHGTLIFGNDYLIGFNDEEEITSIKVLHNNIIPMNYSNQSNDQVATVHNHVKGTGEFITPTDICTLMLYNHLTHWKQHVVISENYVSIWDCINNKLTITDWDEFEKRFPSKESSNNDQ